MIKFYITLISLFAIISNTYCQSDKYFWSGGKKNILMVDSSAIILNPRSVKSIEGMLVDIDGIKKTKVLKEGLVLIELKGDKKISKHKLRRQLFVGNYCYSFNTKSGNRIIPTREILVSPKKGVSIEKIISSSLASISIIRKSKYDEFTLLKTIPMY